jgi:hypothetical protein
VIAPVLLLASVTLLARAVHGLRDWDPGPVARETRRRAATTTVLVFGGLAMNYLLHITTKQEHPLSSGRFLWYVVLALYPVVLYAAASWRAAAVVFVVLTLGVPVARCVKYGLHGYLEKGRGGAFTDNEIRGEYVISRRPPGPAPLPAGSVWVATPDYPWTRALKPTK